jgi:hypothetical protein
VSRNHSTIYGAVTSEMRGKTEAAVDFVVFLRDQLLAR